MLDRVHVRSARALVAGAVVLAALTACTGDDSDDESSLPTTSTGATITLTRPSAPLKVKVARLKGGFKPTERDRIRRAIARPIAAWVGGGFLDVEYPQSSFPDAFTSWTSGAVAQAKRDRDVTTNADVGPQVIATVADLQSATLYVFTSNGHTGGATADVRLRFTSERPDASLIHYVVQGDLYLTRSGSRWRIFGYELSREAVA